MDKCKSCGAEITDANRPAPKQAVGFNLGKCGPCITKFGKRAAIGCLGTLAAPPSASTKFPRRNATKLATCL